MNAYRILLSLHIIGFICWMAGLLYLYRLFVYHAAETEQVVKDRFKIMESKLYRIITMPAMIVTFVVGVAMIVMNPSLAHQGWFHVKLLAVFLMIGVTHMGGKYVRLFSQEKCQKSEKYFRVFNEVPTILMILIVFMVILRPF